MVGGIVAEYTSDIMTELQKLDSKNPKSSQRKRDMRTVEG